MGGTPGVDCTSTCNEAEIQEGEIRADASWWLSELRGGLIDL